MSKKPLNVAVPWSLSHYIPLNGFHPLYRALFDHAPADVKLNGWSNVRLDNLFKRDIQIRQAVYRAAKNYEIELRKQGKESIERKYLEYFWPPNQILTNELVGEIEFHHTSPFPSLKRPFVFHCESFSNVYFPFSQQENATLKNCDKIRKHYLSIFAHPMCIGIFSHIPETLENLSCFFSNADIDRKLYSSRIGLSSKHIVDLKLPEENNLSRPIFLFINSANLNPDDFDKQGGHLVLRFWKEFRASGWDGLLIMRCPEPKKSKMLDYGVDLSFLDVEKGKSIFWTQDYLFNHEMDALMLNANFILLPSASLHSVSIMQAMTFGVVPIVTDIVGTSLYVKDYENGIVLKGLRDGICHTYPGIGMSLDRYSRIPEIDTFLVLQMTERILDILETPGAYDKIKNNAILHMKEHFSGESFSTDFWDSVTNIYKNSKDSISYETLSYEIGQSLEESILKEDEWPGVFENTAQPIRRIYTGQGTVWELGGALLYIDGNPTMELNSWSVFAQYFNNHVKESTFVSNIEQLQGKFLSSHDTTGKESFLWISSSISNLLTPFPKLHSFAAKSLLKLKQYNTALGQYRQFISFKSNRSDAVPDIELVSSDIFDYNIIRYFHKYYAIPQSEGEFIPEKAESDGYSVSFSSLSLERVIKHVIEASGHAKSENGNLEPELIIEGINGYNIIRLGREFHAILQSEGIFEYSKLASGQYREAVSSGSLSELKSLIMRKNDSDPNKDGVLS